MGSRGVDGRKRWGYRDWRDRRRLARPPLYNQGVHEDVPLGGRGPLPLIVITPSSCSPAHTARGIRIGGLVTVFAAL